MSSHLDNQNCKGSYKIDSSTKTLSIKVLYLKIKAASYKQSCA